MLSPPNADELEVSLFGPGVGECVVIHIGNGEWVIVDSCLDPKTGAPVALDYLKRVGVDVATAVVAVVVTHWHDDHTSGAAKVLTACAGASFFCSGALNKREFFQLVSSAGQLELKAGRGSGVDEMARVFEVLKKRKPGGQTAAPNYASASTVLYRRPSSGAIPACTIEALSPSSTSVTRGMISFAPMRGATKRAKPNPGPNELSVALHVEFGVAAALLGADLETGSSDSVGWRAVVVNSRNPTAKASFVKVPHHGSSGADHEPAWNALVASDAQAGVTPFSSSRIPRDADLTRLRGRVQALFHSSPRKGAKVKFDRATQRTLEGIQIRERQSGMGHIRFRSVNGAGVVELFGAAKELAAR